jgi:PAS domain S-box-containing protein
MGFTDGLLTQCRKGVFQIVFGKQDLNFYKENVRKSLTVLLFGVLGIIFMIIFGIQELNTHRPVLGIIVLSYGGFVALILLYLIKSKNYKVSSWILVFLLFSLSLLLLFLGKTQSRLIWYYVFPLTSYFILGIRYGFIVNLVLLIITSFFLWYPTPSMPLYLHGFRIRFLASYIAVSGLAHLYEFIRQRTYQSLISANQEKTDYINRTLKQKEEIRQQSQKLEVINEELRKLSAVVRETHNAIIIMSRNGNIEWINPAFERLYGYSYSDLINRYGEDIIHTDFNKHLTEKANEAIHKKRSLTFESLAETKSGNLLEIQTTLTPVTDNQNRVTRLIALDTDISQLKNAEKELKKLIATRDKFFSIIAHDLKNPFNSLMGISQLLVEKSDSYDMEKIQMFHKNLYSVSKRGYDLLNNLLDWSRSQTGRLSLNIENIRIRDIVKENIRLLISNAESKNLHIENNIPENLFVRADSNSVSTVFRNLLSNAIKYSFDSGTITIDAEEKNNYSYISVTDSGQGVDPENIPRLFKIDEGFSTKGTQKEEGTGLGLIICKEFIEKNGGTISVKSKKGEGSSFTVSLPKAG